MIQNQANVHSDMASDSNLPACKVTQELSPRDFRMEGWVQNVISSQSCRQASTFIRWMSWWIVRAELSIREASALISDHVGSSCILQKHIDWLRSIYSSSSWRFSRSTSLEWEWAEEVFRMMGEMSVPTVHLTLCWTFMDWDDLNEWEPTWTFTWVLHVTRLFLILLLLVLLIMSKTLTQK